MNFRITKTFEKSLLKIKDENILFLVKTSLINVSESLKIEEIKNIKKMKGFSNSYRIKVKEYRICIYYSNDFIDLHKIAHRKDAYNNFP